VSHEALPLEWELWVGDIGGELRMRIGGIANLDPGATVVGKAWREGVRGVNPVDLPGEVVEVLVDDDAAIIALDHDAWLATATQGQWKVNAQVEGVTFPEGAPGKATVRKRTAA
jgi:hypothetical protein